MELRAAGLSALVRARRQQGTSMVEMAVVAPVLLLMLFAIAEFGVAFVQWQTLSNAAREGARVAVVWRDPLNNPGCASSAQSEAESTVTSYASTTISGPVSVSVTTANGNLCDPGADVTVTATANYSFQALPGLAGIPAGITLIGSSTMRNE